MHHCASMIRSGAWSGLAGADLQGLRSAVYTFLSARLEDREPVILSPFAVILSAAKDFGISLRVNLAKNPGICFRGCCDERHRASCGPSLKTKTRKRALQEQWLPRETPMKTFYVYIMAGKFRALYIGVTNNLERRVLQHKRKLVPGFTSKYNINRLVYFETFGDIRAAIQREKQIKGWLRAKKVALIVAGNPTWRDLGEEWLGKQGS